MTVADNGASQPADQPSDAEAAALASVRAERKGRLVTALLKFSWEDYRLHDVEQAIDAGEDDPTCNAWAEELAEDLMAVLLVPSKIRP